MQPPLSIEFALAIATLGDFKKHCRVWIEYYNSVPETAILPGDPRNILEQLYNIDQAYKKLLQETGRIN